jgi:hypothetical protein
MSITDELREYAHDCCARIDDDIHAIADRIDEEHQKAIRELNNFADASVLLPVDADGVPIHVGDEMEYGRAHGRVIALMLSNYPKKWGGALHWGIQLEGEQAPTALDGFFHHYHAPTVEDVLTEFGIDWEHESDCEDRAALLKEYASKLRLAEGEDA